MIKIQSIKYFLLYGYGQKNNLLKKNVLFKNIK